MHSSISSSGSRHGSKRYVVAGKTYVDESLFGDPVQERARKAKDSVAGSISGGIGGSPQKDLYSNSSTSESAAPPVMITSDELYDMRKGSVIKTAEDIRADKREAARLLKEKQAVTDARKEKIKSLEASRIANLPKSLLEQEDLEERARRIKLAEHTKDESQSDVKRMNAIFNYALTVSIRDRQLAEKKERDAQEAAREKMNDLQIEIDALELQQRKEQALESNRGGRDKFRADVLAQLFEALGRKKAQREKMLAEEAVRKAKFAEEAAKEKIKMEELQAKKAAGLAETMALNREAIALKKARKQAELDLDAKVDAEALEIIRQKEAADSEKERIRAEKEAIANRDRGSLAKFLDDTESKLNLQMQRAYEEGARRERAKELERARKQAEALRDLKATRQRMLEEKQEAMAGMIEDEKMEFEIAQRLQAQWLEEQEREEEARSKSNFQFLKDVKSQISDKIAREKEFKDREREELIKSQADYAKYSEDLRRIRDRKVEEMRALGLPGSYMTELQKYDPDRETAKNSMTVAKKQEKIAPLPPPGKGGGKPLKKM
jgi:hypothetical protein